MSYILGGDCTGAPKKLRVDRAAQAQYLNHKENRHLQMQNKLLDKELNHFTYVMEKERAQIVRHINDTRRSSGCSALGMAVERNDPVLRTSPYFTTGRIFSEKAFQRWREAEHHLERTFKFVEAQKMQMQREREGLLKLLKSVGILPSTATVVQLDNKPPSFGGRDNMKDDTLTKRRVISSAHTVRKGATLRRPLSRPHTAHNTVENIAESVSCRGNQLAHAPTDQWDNFSEEIIEVKQTQSAPRRVSAKKKTRFMKEEMLPRPSRLEGREKDTDFNIFNFVPQWKREMIIEAPPVVNEPREELKVRLAVSKSALRRDLERLTDENTKDVTRIEEEERTRKQCTQKNMEETLKRLNEFSL